MLKKKTKNNGGGMEQGQQTASEQPTTDSLTQSDKEDIADMFRPTYTNYTKTKDKNSFLE